MTYSIIARDKDSGELGVAVQSHYFQVGPVVPWAIAGVGAVATQSFVDPSYGKRGLALMRAGKSAPAALSQLLHQDKSSEVRQVAMIDSMTPQERRDPSVINGSRRKRIARGSGARVEDVNRLLKQFGGLAGSKAMKRLAGRMPQFR